MTVIELIIALRALGTNAERLPVMLNVDGTWHYLVDPVNDEDRVVLHFGEP